MTARWRPPYAVRVLAWNRAFALARWRRAGRVARSRVADRSRGPRAAAPPAATVVADERRPS